MKHPYIFFNNTQKLNKMVLGTTNITKTLVSDTIGVARWN